MQKFLDDENENKMIEAVQVMTEVIQLGKTAMHEDLFSCYVLGDAYYDGKLHPLAQSVRKEIFREVMAELEEAFIFVGSAESYLTVFRKVFGESVDVQFTTEAPGWLHIDITADAVALFDFAGVDESGEFEIIDEDLDEIAFQEVKGFKNDYELQLMLNEMVPEGIYCTFTLTLE